MDVSKPLSVLYFLMGKFASVMGYAGTFFCLIMLFSPYSSENDTLDNIIRSFSLLFLISFLILICAGAGIKRQMKRVKFYVSLISSENMTNLQDLANATTKPIKLVRKDLKAMIKARYLRNISLDPSEEKLIIGIVAPRPASAASPSGSGNARCSGCGAINSTGNDRPNFCPYCGSPL